MQSKLIKNNNGIFTFFTIIGIVFAAMLSAMILGVIITSFSPDLSPESELPQPGELADLEVSSSNLRLFTDGLPESSEPQSPITGQTFQYEGEFYVTLSERELFCNQQLANPPLVLESSCYDEQNQKIVVQIKRQTNTASLSDFTLSLSSQVGSEQWSCDSTCGTCTLPYQGTSKVYNLNTNTVPQGLSLFIKDCLISTKSLEICAN